MNQLTAPQIDRFIEDGCIKIENAFPKEIADECRAILWKASGCDQLNPATWTQPVIRIGELADLPFKMAANTPILKAAFDQLAGKNNWQPRVSLGSFPLRFPGKLPAMDTGWHVDASFPGENVSDYLQWRINIYSRGRALLMLFLFSDVSEKDAPTVIRAGSHQDVAKILYPEGEKGLSFMQLAQKIPGLPEREELLATGMAGTVYLCHPFIVHAAQQHQGTLPKFMAQPPLLSNRDFNIDLDKEDHCPVEIAIMNGMKK